MNFMKHMVITRRLEWDSAHRVLRHESKCATLHGHRYAALLSCTAARLDVCDRVVDFGVIKERVGGWIDATWDHATLVNQDDHELLEFAASQALRHGHRKPFAFAAEPTAETLAAVLFDKAHELLASTGVVIASIQLFETTNSSATMSGRGFRGGR